ncbi:MAG: LysR family transcriptional regulator [Deltaproteobacteria bacterium]|nr:LysR family transcriptional regulator [Deltaproteobacteria bacterium]
MDFDDLRCFVAAAHHRNFRRGAKEVALSPAAFSERVARLEEQLGNRLLARTTRSVALTAAGERVLPHAIRLLEDAAELGRFAADDAAQLPYELTIGTRFELGLSWLLPALTALREQAPERRCHLRFGDSAALLDDLEQGLVDAVVTSFRLNRPRLDYATLHEERYVFCAAPSLLQRRPFADRSDAQQHVLIDAHGDLPLFRYLLDANPGREAWTFGSQWMLGAIGAIRDRLLAGDGVGVLPEYLVAADLADGALIRVLPELPLHSDWFRLVFRRGDLRQARLRGLAGELVAFPLR